MSGPSVPLASVLNGHRDQPDRAPSRRPLGPSTIPNQSDQLIKYSTPLTIPTQPVLINPRSTQKSLFVYLPAVFNSGVPRILPGHSCRRVLRLPFRNKSENRGRIASLEAEESTLSQIHTVGYFSA